MNSYKIINIFDNMSCLMIKVVDVDKNVGIKLS